MCSLYHEHRRESVNNSDWDKEEEINVIFHRWAINHENYHHIAGKIFLDPTIHEYVLINLYVDVMVKRLYINYKTNKMIPPHI